MLIAFAIIIAYLLGSISSAIIICKLTGIDDPRTQGSKNAGTTNVLRIGGKKLAFFTLLGDLFKGFVAVMIGRFFGLDGMMLGFVALAAFIGHIYPIFFGFKGGKGVATGIGVLFALSLQLGLAVAITWIIVAVITRYSSLAALIAFVLAPFYTFFFAKPEYVLAVAIMALILCWHHRGNIKRLMKGVESKIGK